MKNSLELEKDLSEKWSVLQPLLNERSKRIWAGMEATSLGHGGISLLERVTGLTRKTISKGIKEIELGLVEGSHIRSSGGGRKSKEILYPDLLAQLDLLVSPYTKGDPMNPLRWTSKSTDKLATELQSQGYEISSKTVGRLLKQQEYSLQLNRKEKEGNGHKDRDAQFKFLNKKVAKFLSSGKAAISVDTKKKENIGNYKNTGRDYYKKGESPKVKVHDFKDKKLGKVAPYGIYDIGINEGWVSVGISSDTAQFAVNSIRSWWYEMGEQIYGDTSEILITADGGGSNSSRSRLWKVELQKLANEIQKKIHVCHFPPGTSKWNKIEHKMFCFITQNWRGKPLISRQTVVELIANTTTKSGLTIKAALDENDYQTGIKVTDQELAKVNLKNNKFHGEWNYYIKPQ